MFSRDSPFCEDWVFVVVCCPPRGLTILGNKLWKVLDFFFFLCLLRSLSRLAIKASASKNYSLVPIKVRLTGKPLESVRICSRSSAYFASWWYLGVVSMSIFRKESIALSGPPFIHDPYWETNSYSRISGNSSRRKLFCFYSSVGFVKKLTSV